MLTMESDKEKYERWLSGREKAKKMWFYKYQNACRERDYAIVAWKVAKRRGLLTGYGIGALAFLSGFCFCYIMFVL